MAKKKTRRKHTANAQIQILGLTKAGSSIEVDMYADGEKLGGSSSAEDRLSGTVTSGRTAGGSRGLPSLRTWTLEEQSKT